MLKSKIILAISLLCIAAGISSCNKDGDVTTTAVKGKDISTAEKVSIDRFSTAAAHLMVRTATNGLPAANAAVNFDNAPFITTGFDRSGNVVHYYNFDVQTTTPSPIYVFFKSGASTPLSGQNNVISVIPGEAGYNDFWLVKKVTVPDTYVANSLTSEDEILASGYTVSATTMLVNCPVVPFGSTAARSKTTGTASSLSTGWYKGKAAAYFSFEEAPITTIGSGMVPFSPIYVMFNNNAAGPSSGFKTETANPMQTHNIPATLPGDVGYSPLWNVFVIDNANFSSISNLATATGFSSTAAGAKVNCPIVK